MTRATGPGAHPKNAAAILIERHHVAVAQTARIARIVSIVSERAGCRLEQIQAFRSGNPQALSVVLENRPDVIVAERAGLVAVMTEARHLALVGIQAVESTAERSDPQGSRVVLTDRSNPHVGERRATGRGAIVDEILCGRLVFAQATIGPNPDTAGTVDIQDANHIGRE